MNEFEFDAGPRRKLTEDADAILRQGRLLDEGADCGHVGRLRYSRPAARTRWGPAELRRMHTHPPRAGSVGPRRAAEGTDTVPFFYDGGARRPRYDRGSVGCSARRVGRYSPADVLQIQPHPFAWSSDIRQATPGRCPVMSRNLISIRPRSAEDDF